MGGKERRDPWESVGMSGKDTVTCDNGSGNVMGETPDVPTPGTTDPWEDLPAWVADHLRDAIAETLRKREAKAQQRAELSRRRALGLKARHQAKLNRSRGQGE